MKKQKIVTRVEPRAAGGYHPGNIVCDEALSRDPPPAVSATVDSPATLLYDAQGRPLRRPIGFRKS